MEKGAQEAFVQKPLIKLNPTHANVYAYIGVDKEMDSYMKCSATALVQALEIEEKNHITKIDN